MIFYPSTTGDRTDLLKLLQYPTHYPTQFHDSKDSSQQEFGEDEHLAASWIDEQKWSFIEHQIYEINNKKMASLPKTQVGDARLEKENELICYRGLKQEGLRGMKQFAHIHEGQQGSPFYLVEWEGDDMLETKTDSNPIFSNPFIQFIDGNQDERNNNTVNLKSHLLNFSLMKPGYYHQEEEDEKENMGWIPNNMALNNMMIQSSNNKSSSSKNDKSSSLLNNVFVPEGDSYTFDPYSQWKSKLSQWNDDNSKQLQQQAQKLESSSSAVLEAGHCGGEEQDTVVGEQEEQVLDEENTTSNEPDEMDTLLTFLSKFDEKVAAIWGQESSSESGGTLHNTNPWGNNEQTDIRLAPTSNSFDYQQIEDETTVVENSGGEAVHHHDPSPEARKYNIMNSTKQYFGNARQVANPPKNGAQQNQQQPVRKDSQTSLHAKGAGTTSAGTVCKTNSKEEDLPVTQHDSEKTIITCNKSVSQDDLENYKKWMTEFGSSYAPKNLTVLNHSDERSGFIKFIPIYSDQKQDLKFSNFRKFNQLEHKASSLKEMLNNLELDGCDAEEQEIVAACSQPLKSLDEGPTDDLLTSWKTHFRPVGASDQIETEASSPAAILNHPQLPEFRTSDYMEKDYVLYQRASSAAFQVRFKLCRENEKGNQTEEISQFSFNRGFDFGSFHQTPLITDYGDYGIHGSHWLSEEEEPRDGVEEYSWPDGRLVNSYMHAFEEYGSNTTNDNDSNAAFCFTEGLSNHKNNKQSKANRRRAKGKPCKYFFMDGLCRRGNECKFSHEHVDWKFYTCRFWAEGGSCLKDPCPFLHCFLDAKDFEGHDSLGHQILDTKYQLPLSAVWDNNEQSYQLESESDFPALGSTKISSRVPISENNGIKVMDMLSDDEGNILNKKSEDEEEEAEWPQHQSNWICSLISTNDKRKKKT